jgi:predicted ATPase
MQPRSPVRAAGRSSRRWRIQASASQACFTNSNSGDDPLAQMDSQIKGRRTQEAVKRLLLRESLDRPLMVIFEDLHWIDSETQGLLKTLVDSIVNTRILLLVNYRPEYRHEWSNRTHYSQLRLDPLGRETAGEVLSSLLGDDVHLARCDG